MLLGALGMFGTGLVVFALTYAFARIPEPDEIARAQAVAVLDHEGRAIGRFHAGADRVSIPLGDMPDDFRNAVIAVEDRRFHSHSGISPISILRATFRNATAGRAVQGGSTITQQYVKNAFVGNERSIARKFKEAVLAMKLERRWSKDQILEAYLNTIYLGRGAYGVEAAARTYFGRKAKDMSLPQSALLAGMIRAPESYDPARDRALARDRRDLVLDLMVREELLDSSDAAKAKRADVKVRKRRPGGTAPHFLEDVRKLLETEVGPRILYGGGITVTTTLDLDMQRAAERAVRAVYDRKNDPQAALVAIDPATGSVRAMVGSRSFARLEFNLASRARRQPGSTFKTAVLATAVDEGIPTTDTYRAPAQITIETDAGPWKVSNYDHADHGRLTIERATELSVNTVYAQLITDVDPADVADVAGRLGIISDLEPVPSLALGTSGVTTQELTSMYATLAARGTWREPILVEQVTDADGTVLFEPEPAEERVLEREVADRVNATLQGVITEGTGRSADIGRPAAGKTGTTEDFRDAWFAGYTPDLAAVVWNGYPKRKTLEDVRGISVTGGSFPAQIWTAFMREALADVTPTPFPAPGPRKDKDSRSTTSPSPVESLVPSETPTPIKTPTKTSSPSPSGSPTPTPSPTKSKSPTPTSSPSSST